VEPQPNPSSTPPPPSAEPPPPARAGAAQADGATTTSSPPDDVVVLCPDCGEPRAEDARFCEECGHDYGGGAEPAAAAEERSVLSGPLLWAVLVFWVVLIVGGLLFLYNALWAI
jgi:hypothetical protein